MSKAMEHYLRLKNWKVESDDEETLHDYYTLRNAFAIMALAQEDVKKEQ